MKLYDDAYPDYLQVTTMMQTITPQDFLGTEDGELSFAYAMSCENGQPAADSLLAQLRTIDLMGHAYNLRVMYNMIYIDQAACDFTTRRLGLHRLRVACRSNLFDARAIMAQSPCRVSRMPDEQEELRKEWQGLGYRLIYHTTMPAVSMAELDAYYHPETRSGFTR